MEGLGHPPRRLASRGPACQGLAVDEEGVVFGSSDILVRKTAQGYRSLGTCALRKRFSDVSEVHVDGPRIVSQLAGIARALDDGDLVHAQLLGLLLPFAASAMRLDRSGGRLNKVYDAFEPRDANGRWITVGAGTAVSVIEGAGLFGAAEDTAVTIGGITLGTALAAAGGAITGMLYPSGHWATYQGTLPDHPDIDYRYDEGFLSLYRTGTDGKPEILYQGRANDDGFYIDAAGNVIGRDLGGPFQVDSRLIAVGRSDKARDFITARTAAATDKPQVCPDPTFDWPHAASARAIAYQEQITRLPMGVGVALNGVIYDGCDELTGFMLDAKGPGYERFMRYGFWPSIVEKLDNLARRQSKAAGDRMVEWHFAEEAPANAMREHFRKMGFDKILVIYTPAAAPQESED